MVELGDKHGGHAIDGCTALLMDRGEHHEGVELLDHHLRTAVGQTVHRGEHHAEAMEQGHADAELVVLGKAHVLAREVTVVGDTVVGQHNALGEARGTRGVLHVAHVVTADVLLHLVEHTVFYVLTKKQQFGGIVHAAVFLHTDIDHILQVGELLAVQVAALAGLQLRQHGVGHVDVVTIPCAVGDTEHLHVGVLTEVLQFVLLIVGVYRHEHGTNLRRSIEEGEPVRHVGSPDTHIGTFLHADRYQAFSQIIHTLVELRPGEAQVAV